MGPRLRRGSGRFRGLESAVATPLMPEARASLLIGVTSLSAALLEPLHDVGSAEPQLLAELQCRRTLALPSPVVDRGDGAVEVRGELNDRQQFRQRCPGRSVLRHIGQSRYQFDLDLSLN
jgi:hypothetical protein